MQLKNIFVEGAIAPSFIADSITKHATKTNIGAHNIFLGQVRADSINNKQVIGIEYTSNQPMALECMQAIREQIFEKYDWYAPISTNVEGELNQIERANITKIKEYESYYNDYGNFDAR